MSEGTPLPADVLACPRESAAAVLWGRLTLSRLAPYLAARYNGPVYLVGSALRVAKPRDVDIRVIVADAEFCGRYGCELEGNLDSQWPNQAWIDDMAKRNGEIARDFKLNADFQVYPAGHCIQFRSKPRVLLASPSNLDHIAACTAWFDNPPATQTAPATERT